MNEEATGGKNAREPEPAEVEMTVPVRYTTGSPSLDVEVEQDYVPDVDEVVRRRALAAARASFPPGADLEILTVMAIPGPGDEPNAVRYKCVVTVGGEAAAGSPASAITAVQHDAAVWSDHPDYREEWKP
jgi:hypothetical protein